MMSTILKHKVERCVKMDRNELALIGVILTTTVHRHVPCVQDDSTQTTHNMVYLSLLLLCERVLIAHINGVLSSRGSFGLAVKRVAHVSK